MDERTSNPIPDSAFDPVPASDGASAADAGFRLDSVFSAASTPDSVYASVFGSASEPDAASTPDSVFASVFGDDPKPSAAAASAPASKPEPVVDASLGAAFDALFGADSAVDAARASAAKPVAEAQSEIDASLDAAFDALFNPAPETAAEPAPDPAPSADEIRSSGTDSVVPNRSDKVRNFHVHIDEDAGVGDFSYTKDRPVYKGEVYFSNHKRGADSVPVQSTRPVGAARPARTETQPAVRRADQAPAAQTNPPKKKKKKKKKHGYLSSAAKLLISVAICTGLLSAIGITTMNDILAINRSTEPVAVELPENADTDTVIDVLHEAKLISNPLLCKTFYHLECKIRNTKEPKYIAGMISLKASMGLEGMINRVKENQQLTETVKLYFPEGWTAKQIFEKLAKYEVCEADFLYKAIEDINFNYSFLTSAKSANSAGRYLLLEGYLFPDTYEFFVDYNANSVIERFLTRFDEIWTDEYQARAEELNMTVDEVVRLASIIQREAANKQQMSQISSVLHNRLHHSVNYPTLDCDSTYNYIDTYVTPVVGEVLGGQYRQTYNTYVCEKLPAGAICNPGADAIHAALYPDETDYYYFQHDKQGNIYLARTNAEHNRYRSEIAWKNAG